MKPLKIYSVLIAAVCLLSGAVVQEEFPQASISNGIINARFYLPDAEKGYYRGTRFDWSGVIPELTWQQHSYCSQWFSNYSPTLHDAIMGPVESFSPLGYETAGAGGHFVQVGVGILSKPTNDAYSAFTYYPVINAGKWKIKPKASSITFTHTLEDTAFSYIYTKTATLLKGKPVMVLTHSLKNTGQQAIATNVYNHNLFVLDKQGTGPGADISFPFLLQGEPQGQKNFGPTSLATIKGNQVMFNRPFEKKESVYTILHGFGNNSKDYDIKIENHHTGAAVHITSDRALVKLVFWGSATIYSPEPYININIPAGDTFKWTTTYEFYACKTEAPLIQ